MMCQNHNGSPEAATENRPAPGNEPQQNETVQQEPPQDETLQATAPAPGATPYQSPFAPSTGYAVPKTIVQEPFLADKTDGWFALVFFVLGFLFVRWLLFSGWEGWGVTLFTACYTGVILIYAKIKKMFFGKESWFWLVILLLTAGSFAVWPGGTVYFWRMLLLFSAAVYWVAALFQGLLRGKTGNWLFFDVMNMFFIVPFQNFGTWLKSLKALSSRKGKKRNFWPVVTGVLLGVLLLAFLIPKLLRADSGNFAGLMQGVGDFLSALFIESVVENLIQLVLAIPVTFYLCGLLQGYAHRRATRKIKPESVASAAGQARLLPQISVTIALGLVSMLYMIFIFCQIPYFFSAFAGVKPEEFLFYATYAREGFFELCTIAGVNLFLLLAANLLCKEKKETSTLLRVFNVLLSVLTLLLVATALRKMMLYIERHGLTQRRVLPCVFLLFLAGTFLAVIFLQWKSFSIVRFTAAFATLLLCALCLVNIDVLVLRYNTSRFLNGTLDSYELEYVYRADAAGLPSAWEVYESGRLTEAEKSELLLALRSIETTANNMRGETVDTLSYARARAADQKF